jgi:ferredoxin-NADP reductase
MDIYDITLIDSEEVAADTRAFRFTKPAGFTFVPGQFANFSLIDPPESDAAGPLRSFSIASAPHEHEIMIATRMRGSAFKRTLARLPMGARLEMEGPYGVLVLEDDGRPAVFVAGGIGITPFRSILYDAAHRAIRRKITLIYGNRAPEGAAFLSELDALAQRLPGLSLVHRMAEAGTGTCPWPGDTGFIDEQFLARHVRDVSAPTWYVVGSPAMTTAVREVLSNLGVDDGAVRVEDFAGY